MLLYMSVYMCTIGSNLNIKDYTGSNLGITTLIHWECDSTGRGVYGGGNMLGRGGGGDMLKQTKPT